MYGTERNHVRARCTHHRQRHVRLIRPERHHQLKNRVNRPNKPTDPLPRPVLPLSPSRGDAGDLAYLETRTPHLRKTPIEVNQGEGSGLALKMDLQYAQFSHIRASSAHFQLILM